MWELIAALLYTFITISKATESNSSCSEESVVLERTDPYIDNEEFRFVVSLGVFKDGNYTHICLAAMVTGLVGLTSGKCGDYDYYAERAGLTEIEDNLTEENPKLHVNTKRPMYLNPDMLYTVIRFIDFDKYLFHKRGNKSAPLPDIGVFVLNKKVRYIRPAPDVPIPRIKSENLPALELLTVIGMNTIGEKSLQENMLMKKSILSLDYFYYKTAKAYLKLSQFHVSRECFYRRIFLEKDDLGGPVYLEDQFFGILVNEEYAIVTNEALLQKHIDEIINSTLIPQMEECETTKKRKRD